MIHNDACLANVSSRLSSDLGYIPEDAALLKQTILNRCGGCGSLPDCCRILNAVRDSHARASPFAVAKQTNN